MYHYCFLQVDAAVLHAVLDREGASPSCTSRLIPGALDIVEVAVNSKAEFTCSPALWRALAGCGHCIMSATFAAVAAELAPLTAAATAHVERQEIGPAAKKELDDSLKLPDAETVELISGTHAVYALDYAGWLHGQLMKAAGANKRCCICLQDIQTRSTNVGVTAM
jgi:hypothetical protein